MASLKKQVLDLMDNSAVTEEEFREVFEALRDLFRHRQAEMGRRAARNFSAGDVVVLTKNIGRRLPSGVVGKIEKINPKYIHVDFGTYGLWRVFGTDLKVAPAGTKFKKNKLEMVSFDKDEDESERRMARAESR